MKKLVILDYPNGSVEIYDIDREESVDDSYIEDLGYRANDCYWMVGELEINFHKEIIH